MLKHRIIFGLPFGALFLAIIFFDSFCSRGWPVQGWSTPPGMFVGLGCLLLIPLALREMRTLLAPENVIISMRITIAASLLCMLWPWVEQMSESVLQKHRDLQTQIALEGKAEVKTSNPHATVARPRGIKSPTSDKVVRGGLENCLAFVNRKVKQTWYDRFSCERS